MIIELQYKSGKKEMIDVREQNFGTIILKAEGESDRTFVHLDDHEVKCFRANHVFIEVGFVVVEIAANSDSDSSPDSTPKTA